MRHTLISFLLSVIPLVGQGQVILEPNNLNALFTSGKRIIHLSWDSSDSKVAGYNLFVKQGKDDSFFLWGKAGLISGTNYDYQVLSRDGDSFEFKVCAVQNFPKVVRSGYSNVVNIYVPSSFIPMVNINKLIIKKSTAEIFWLFDSKTSDLDGFVIYLDKVEVMVSKETRSYLFEELTSGNHTLYITAISKTGLRSAPSAKKLISIK